MISLYSKEYLLDDVNPLDSPSETFKSKKRITKVQVKEDLYLRYKDDRYRVGYLDSTRTFGLGIVNLG